MTKKLLLVLCLAAAVVLPAIANGSAEDPLRGTWYGGSSNPDNVGFKYQYTFIPTGPNRWHAMADGAYNPDSLGAAVETRWTGEVLRANGKYEIRLIALTTNDPVDPPDELPKIHAVRGYVSFPSSGAAQIQYDLFGTYDWSQTPFVDEPVSWILEPGQGTIDEKIQRVDTQVSYK